MGTAPLGRYALLNARNRVRALEYERDHPEQFPNRHTGPRALPIAVLIDRARQHLAELEARDRLRGHNTSHHGAQDGENGALCVSGVAGVQKNAR